MKSLTLLSGVVVALVLSGCNTASIKKFGDDITQSLGSITKSDSGEAIQTDDLDEYGDSVATAEKVIDKASQFSADWGSAPALSKENCSEMTSEDVGDFIENYYQPYTKSVTKDKVVSIEYMYTVATTLGLRSQSCMADALDLKELAFELAQEQKVLSAGTSMSRNEIEKSRIISQRASDEIAAALKEEKSLKGDQRKAFAIGAAAFLTSANETLNIKNSVFSLAKDLSKFEKLSVKSVGKYFDKADKIAQAKRLTKYKDGLGDHTGNLTSTSRFLLDYASKQDVDIVGEVDKRLSQEFGF